MNKINYNKIMKKLLASLFIVSFVLAGAFVFVLPAQATSPSLWGDEATKRNIQTALNYGDPEDPRVIAATIINVFLGFLGIVAVVLIIWAGFTWMTAGGNEEKIEKAQKTLSAAIIGLIIILAAWGIASFITDSLVDATT